MAPSLPSDPGATAGCAPEAPGLLLVARGADGLFRDEHGRVFSGEIVVENVDGSFLGRPAEYCPECGQEIPGA